MIQWLRDYISLMKDPSKALKLTLIVLSLAAFSKRIYFLSQ